MQCSTLNMQVGLTLAIMRRTRSKQTLFPQEKAGFELRVNLEVGARAFLEKEPVALVVLVGLMGSDVIRQHSSKKNPVQNS